MTSASASRTPWRAALLLLCAALPLTATACASDSGPTAAAPAPQAMHTPSAKEGTTQYFTATTPIQHVIDDPAFSGFGRLLFPSPDREIPASLTLADVGQLMPYHSHVNTGTTVDVLNDLKARAERGERIFTPIYSEHEMQQDPSKRDTGLFIFTGRQGAPFAAINAGGGFSYVGAMHESLPHALHLARNGYNAFAPIYRTGGEWIADEDLAASLQYIFDHASELGVSTNGYSVWGGSAGARMAADIGSYGAGSFGARNLPWPAAVIMQYTGRTEYTRSDPPTYAVVGDNDGIANWRTMQSRIDNLNAAGIDTEFHHYPRLGHGFGLGVGTAAEGWIDDATAFWQRHIEP